MTYCLVINSLLQDVTHLVGSGRVSRIVHIEHSVASTGSQQYIVTTIVHISHNTMALGETRADGGLRGSFNALELGDAKSINTSPDNVAATSIATVALQPRVQTPRVLLDTLFIKVKYITRLYIAKIHINVRNIKQITLVVRIMATELMAQPALQMV